MNEQLTVKNFGPIKDATVDFKRVTVFIGPTGGGKSTLAKLAAIYRESSFLFKNKKEAQDIFNDYSIKNYFKNNTSITLSKNNREISNIKNNFLIRRREYNSEWDGNLSLIYDNEKRKKLFELYKNINIEDFNIMLNNIINPTNDKNAIVYIPAERIFSASIEFSWPGLLRNDIGLPKTLLNFSNSFFKAKKELHNFNINILNVTYIHKNGNDYIKIPKERKLIRLHEAASGIQSVIPLVILIESLTINVNSLHSFIIEEPELNLYPTAQQGLMNWLVEKCTKGENDLTITTHSPYILSHLNLLLYAYQVAENHPDRVDDVAKIVPRESWIDPKEFACYHVEGQKENGVHSIVNPETRLISYNMLDAIAGMETTDFEKLLDINAGLEVE